VLTLADEWTELVPGDDTRRIAAAVHLADAWLAERVAAKEIKLALQPLPSKCIFHGHCHQRSLIGVKGTAQAIGSIPGVDLEVLDAGCCGMAGAFGYESEHYDLSVQIAGLELLPALERNAESIVAATGTSCRHQIRDLTGREALHPIELIRRAITPE
jgi:Fe-S oxidoreductase